jgi:hypothetical protein
MKIEFIKEQKLDGTITYYSKIDDSYVSDSLSLDKDKAYERYKKLVESKGDKKSIIEVEVIESIKL